MFVKCTAHCCPLSSTPFEYSPPVPRGAVPTGRQRHCQITTYFSRCTSYYTCPAEITLNLCACCGHSVDRLFRSRGVFIRQALRLGTFSTCRFMFFICVHLFLVSNGKCTYISRIFARGEERPTNIQECHTCALHQMFALCASGIPPTM